MSGSDYAAEKAPAGVKSMVGKTETGVNKILKYAEDWPAFALSGGAAVAASGNHPFLVVVLITLASISKAIPSLIPEWKNKKTGILEDNLLFGFAAIGLATYLCFNNLDWAIVAISAGIISKTGLALKRDNNRKERFENILSLCLVTAGAFIYFSTGDPAPNVGLLLPSASVVTKTASSLIIGGRLFQFGTGAVIGLILAGSVLAAATASPLTLVAGTGCNIAAEANFRAPLTVGFYLSGGPDDLIKKAKKWYFLGRDNPPTNSSLTVQSFFYDNDTYYKYPPNGNQYDVWVDIGHLDDKGNFHFEESSNPCHVSISPQPKQQDLHFLSNNPGQWQGYIVQGDSVGFYISLQHYTPLTWGWDDGNENDAKDEINTHNVNPSHKYSDPSAYTVILIAGQDKWYFPVLVIPPLPITGSIEAVDLNGSKLFVPNDTLSFSFKTNSNTKNSLPSKVNYSWVIGNDKPKCTNSSKIQHKFPASGNFPVKVSVMGTDCTTVFNVASTTITILDRPAITSIDQFDNDVGGKMATVNGAGFPPGSTIKVTIDNIRSIESLADSSGHFTTTTFPILNLPNLLKHTVIAESMDAYHVKESKDFTITQ